MQLAVSSFGARRQMEQYLASILGNPQAQSTASRGIPDPRRRDMFPTGRQRCLVHRLRNLRSKAPETQWPEIAIRARACYEAASTATSVRPYEAPNPRLKHPRDAPLGITRSLHQL